MGKAKSQVGFGYGTAIRIVGGGIARNVGCRAEDRCLSDYRLLAKGKTESEAQVWVCRVFRRNWTGATGASMSSNDGGTLPSPDIHAATSLAMSQSLVRQTYASRMHSALGFRAVAFALVLSDLPADGLFHRRLFH